MRTDTTIGVGITIMLLVVTLLLACGLYDLGKSHGKLKMYENPPNCPIPIMTEEEAINLMRNAVDEKN